jgi:hypothetical protein
VKKLATLVETDSAAGWLVHELAVKAEVNGRRLTGGGARCAESCGARCAERQ